MANNSGFALTAGKSVGAGIVEDFADALGIGTTRREREWQESMSNTAYQRAVADMKEAGLNPAMMYAGGSNMQASSGPHSAASNGQLGQIASVVSSAAQLLAVNDDSKRSESLNKENKQIVNSAAKMIKTAQLLAKFGL